MEAVAEAVMDMQAMKRDKCGHDSNVTTEGQ